MNQQKNYITPQGYASLKEEFDQLYKVERPKVVSDVAPAQQQGLDKVFFGAWVTLYSVNHDTEHTYRIVGQDELDPGKGYISWISPLARALMKKGEGDTVRLETPGGEEEYEILEVSYHQPSAV